MSRNRKVILAVRILLFVGLGVLFILKGMGMEINTTKALFIVIGLADFAYAWFLSKPFRRQTEEAREE